MEKEIIPRDNVGYARNYRVVAVASNCFETPTTSLPTETITIEEYREYGGVPLASEGEITRDDELLARRPGKPMLRFQDSPLAYPRIFAAALEIALQ